MIRSLLTLLTLAAMALAAVGSTGANFSALQQNGGNRYTAKADWVGPTVTMNDPGTPLHGTIPVRATASDPGTGVQWVTIQRSPAGTGTWTSICTDATSPYECSLDTTAATPDGLYDFRATATDNSSNTSTSASVTNRRIDNIGPTGVTMADPGTPISGTKAFTGTATDAGSGVASLTFQYKPSSGGVWLDACSDSSPPFGCSADTTTIADGAYDFQAVATDNATHVTASVVHTNKRIDNAAPSATMNDPGANLKGTVSLTAAAADAGGIANVVIQRRPDGGSTWTTICTASVVVYTCSLDTQAGATPDGLYDFQAIATDNANRSTTSNVVLARRIDNTAPASVTITNPGASVSGNKMLTGTGTDGGSGIQTIALQYSPTGAGSWTTACSGTASPTNCNFDTTTIADGVYDFRTLATDNAGNQTASATASPNSRVDNFAPTVTMNDPGAYLADTISFTATAADGGGIANVVIQRRPSGGSTWTTICTTAVSPYTCVYNTSGAGGLADGNYDFQAIATDNAARVTTSSVVLNRYVDNTNPGTATMTNPGTPVMGIVTFAGTAVDAQSGIASATIQISTAGDNAWTTACIDTTSPYSCTYDTTQVADGLYDFRLVATDRAGNFRNSAKQGNKAIDNHAPTVTMGDPGAWLSGTEVLTATASDGAGGSGITSVKIQYKTTAGSTWIDVCTDNATPFQCSLNTTTLTTGTQYDFRAIATDAVAWSTTSAVVGPRTVDNVAPSLAFTAPAGPLRGSVALTSTASDTPSGIASVLYQYKLSSGSTWSTACTGSTSPWSCNWASTAVAENAYDLRAIATDNAGNQTTSAASTNRVVDNDITPTGTDVQTTEGGGTAGKAQVNDTIRFTFSEPIVPGSVLSGWTGASGTAVVVRIDDFGSLDRLSVWNGTDAAITNLTTDSASAGVSLFGNYTAGGVKFNGTMTMSGTVVTVTLNSIRSGSVPTGAVTAQTMQWVTSSGVTDLAGNPVVSQSVGESGGNADRDF
jgi:hypothetical protein